MYIHCDGGWWTDLREKGGVGGLEGKDEGIFLAGEAGNGQEENRLILR